MYKDTWKHWIPIIGIYYLLNMNKGEAIPHIITDNEMSAAAYQGAVSTFFIFILVFSLI